MPQSASGGDVKTCRIGKFLRNNRAKVSSVDVAYHNILFIFCQIWLSMVIKNDLEPPCLFPILRFTMSNQLSSLSTAELRRAADLQEKIEALNEELASILGESAPAPAKAPVKKGGMSVAGRAKIAAAQRARWAKAKAGKPAAEPAAKAPAKKRGMSAAARAKIAAAAKARWAKAKAAGKKSL
jgi:hypothetical protein